MSSNSDTIWGKIGKVLAAIAAVIAIIAFITGRNNLPTLFSTPTPIVIKIESNPVTAFPPTAIPLVPTPTVPLVPTPTISKQIGTMRWEIKDFTTGQVLAKGDSSIYGKDVSVEIKPCDGASCYDEKIPLGANFSFGIFVRPVDTQAGLTGFGLTLTRTDLDTFSWDWFNVKNNQIADKLQGGGQLQYDIGLRSGKWELSQIKFLTDVVLRDFMHFELQQPKWICTIFKDSWIVLPPHK